jgi:hypothetical protein
MRLSSSILIALTLLSCHFKQKNEDVDHIILAINDLEKGTREFEDKTGIKPIYGGIHPNSYTQNAIVSLDNKVYLEILAPRTDIDSIPNWLMNIEKLTPIGWAISTTDIQLTRDKLTSLNITTSLPESGSREKPDGTILKWTTFGINNDESSTTPFFIKWDKDSFHPSQGTTNECKIEEINLLSEDKNLVELLKALNIDFTNVIASKADKLEVTISSPKGHVTFK